MTKPSIEQLQDQIECLVREYVAASRAAATAAMDRAFAEPAARRSPVRRPAPRSCPGRRRSPDELAGLSETLYAAICANPGALMVSLAARVGTGARELHRPALLLKRTGRVRSVGQRQQTRYFPIASKA